MQRKSVLRGAVTVVTAASLAAVSVIGASTANAAPSRTAVPGTAPAWIGHAQKTGKASDSAAVSARIYLAPRGGLTALKAAAVAASTPGTSTYRKFISTDQYNAAYQPTKATVTAVSAWLTANGLKVTSVADGNRYLTVTGNVAAAQKAFAVSVDTFTHDGQSVQAPASTLTVPSDISTAVLAVSGLDTSSRVLTHSDTPAPPTDSFVNARPCSQYYGQVAGKYTGDYHTKLPTFQGKTLPYTVCGYTGVQLRTAYEGPTALDGAGVSVAVVDAYASPTMPADVRQYTAAHGDGGYTAGQLLQVKPSQLLHADECGENGWYGEETLDIEAVHAMAPAANIRYYGAKSCYDTDLIDTLQKIVNQNTVQIITNSYGDAGESGATADSVAAWEQVFLQGALEGISTLFSSGDSGDDLASTGLKSADYPASDPYVTAVGGTSDAIDASGNLSWQAGWGTVKYNLTADGKSWSSVGFTSGAGGGYSTLFDRPTYQNGVIPTSAPAGRAVPDVAMDADPNTGFLVGQTQTYPDGSVHYGEYRIGGTSLASPLFAGMTALTLQSAGGKGLGLLNPTIYGQFKKGTFTDVKGAPKDVGNVRADYANVNDPSGGILYSVRLFGMDSSLPVTTGWDSVTGIGSPNKGWLTAVKPLV